MRLPTDDWLNDCKWDAIKEAEDPSRKVELLHALFEEGMDLAFGWSYRKKKSSEPPWMTDWIRSLIRIRRAIFRIEGRSDAWKEKKQETTRIIKQRKNTYDRTLPLLTVNQVANLLRKTKKSRTLVPGDLSPQLYSAYSVKLADPITNIFNSITSTNRWPSLWKTEYITVIPKVSSPTELGECRNIACTNFLSKVYENLLLGWTRQEVKTKANQFGGERGRGKEHLLVTLWHEIGSGLEDNRNAIVLSAKDFSKAFNQLEHEACLRAFQRKGASNQVVALLLAFLSERKMTVRVGKSRSDPRSINAGAPQRSVLGCFLFNIGIDDIEEDVVYTTTGRTDLHGSLEVLPDRDNQLPDMTWAVKDKHIYTL